jgi:TonB family protein
MSVQKKCLTASAITHGLLVVLFFVGSAFAPQKPKPQPQMTPFELVNIPLNLVEEPNVVRGNAGGNPPAAVPREKLPPLTQKNDPPPVKPVEPPVKPVEQPKQEVVKIEPIKPAPRVPESFDLRNLKTIKANDKQEKDEAPKFNLKDATKKVVKTAPTTPSNSQSSNSRETERATEIAKLLDGARQTLAGTGARVDFNSSIIGSGGAEQISYDRVVVGIFEREFRRRPVPRRGNEPAVEVEVVVRRDGSVSSRIVKKSGRAQLDRTVQQVLDSTPKVIPFPASFQSDTRTITINFKLDDIGNG